MVIGTLCYVTTHLHKNPEILAFAKNKNAKHSEAGSPKPIC